ncbi:MAG: GreA/GreB family elongation factor [Bacilli bacterium]|nr:GreA/GreB family elongation factor [Bacilli bacterium]
MAEEKIEMTQAGLDEVEKKYRYLLDVERKEVLEALVAAREQGDLSENADYTAAKHKLGEIDGEIERLQHIKDVAVIIDSKEGRSKKINIGHTVEYREIKTGDVQVVKVVGTVEVDPLATKSPIPYISGRSALGTALIGHEVGDTVRVECNVPYEIEIISVSYKSSEK